MHIWRAFSVSLPQALSLLIKDTTSPSHFNFACSIYSLVSCKYTHHIDGAVAHWRGNLASERVNLASGRVNLASESDYLATALNFNFHSLRPGLEEFGLRECGLNFREPPEITGDAGKSYRLQLLLVRSYPESN